MVEYLPLFTDSGVNNCFSYAFVRTKFSTMPRSDLHI